MKKVIHFFVVVLFCLTVANSLPNAFAGASPRPGPVSYYDPNEGTTTPFFPYGWESHHSQWAYASYVMLGAGGNTVFSTFGTDSTSLANLTIILDFARAQGKKVVLKLVEDAFFLGVDPSTPSTYADLELFVNTAKEHPALLGYILGDENEWSFSGTAQDIVNSATVINQLDGHRPVWQIFSIFDGIKQAPYLPGTSVYSEGTYPNHSTSFDPADTPDSFLDMENYLNPIIGQTAAANGASNVICTQAFGFDAAPSIPANWRLPTIKEHRWNVFSAITAAGSRGTLNWMYEPGWYSDPGGKAEFSQWLSGVAFAVFDEQEMIANGMENGYNAGAVYANWTDKASDESGGWVQSYDRITQLLVHDDLAGKYFLIVTNNGAAVQDVDFTLSGLPSPVANLDVIVHDEAGSGEIITLTDLGSDSYRLDDTLQGFDVMIYSINAISSQRYFIGNTGSGWDTRSGVVDYGASSALAGRAPVNTVTGGGISADGLTHNTVVFDYPPPVGDGGMWLSADAVDGGGVIDGFGTHYIVWIFDQAYELYEMWIWNYNESNWSLAGMKEVRIVADTGSGWAGGTTIFDGIIPEATGGDTPVSLVVDCGGVEAIGVGIFSVYGDNHNWSGGSTLHTGLSEVRFYIEPCKAAIEVGLGIAADLNNDCYVNLADLAVFTQDWLQCVETQEQGCD